MQELTKIRRAFVHVCIANTSYERKGVNNYYPEIKRFGKQLTIFGDGPRMVDNLRRNAEKWASKNCRMYHGRCAAPCWAKCSAALDSIIKEALYQ